jgi:hypothetical protein
MWTWSDNYRPFHFVKTQISLILQEKKIPYLNYMGIITTTVWIIHWLLVEATASKERVGNVHRKAVTDPMHFPIFRVRKGVITPHRKEQCITKCNTLIRASSCDASGPYR